jgi:hypothetical protein
MPSSLRKDVQNLTQTDPSAKPRGRVCALTRHPTALATAQAHLLTLKLRSLERVLMGLLLMRADREGLCWEQITGELARLMNPGERRMTDKRLQVWKKRIQVAARRLRVLGLLEWKWIRPMSRYPKRISYYEPAVWNRGEKTNHGGRVWIVKWGAFGVRLGLPNVGTILARVIPEDHSGVIRKDHSSDLLRSPSEIGTIDPALAPEASAPAPSSTADVTEIGRSLRSRPGPDESAPALPAKVASETPRAPEAARAAQDDPTSKREKPESLEGARAPRSRPPVPLPAFLAECERRFGAGTWLTTANRLENASENREASSPPPDPDRRE